MASTPTRVGALGRRASRALLERVARETARAGEPARGSMMSSEVTRAFESPVGRARAVATTSRVSRSSESDEATTSVTIALREMSAERRAEVVASALRADDALREAVWSSLADCGTMGRLFERADANEDGVLDKKEFLMALGGREGEAGGASASASATTMEQLRAVALSQAVPFVGFGLCDNAVMITAGESIETALGVGLGLSTMAAAGFGNTVSDVVGIGLSSKIESFAERLGFQAPSLTRAQRMSTAVRWARVAGATSGVTLGCLLGMFPLALGW
jgi:tRNA-specific adenosine deaminase 1